MIDKQGVYDLLKARHIVYEAVEHAPVYTIEEMDEQQIPHMELVAKNLFLRDSSKKHFFLVTMPGHKKLDLKELRARLGTSHLSFANEDRLWEFLHLERGHVTPFGLLNDEDCKVLAVFDEELQGQQIGVHPMENTATVFMAFDDLLALLQDHGTTVRLCNLNDM